MVSAALQHPSGGDQGGAAPPDPAVAQSLPRRAALAAALVGAAAPWLFTSAALAVSLRQPPHTHGSHIAACEMSYMLSAR